MLKNQRDHPTDSISIMDKVYRIESFLVGFQLFKHLVHHIDGLDFLAVYNL